MATRFADIAFSRVGSGSLNLEHALLRQKRLRVAGVDDAPFQRGSAEPVHFAAVICAETRFEGMLWGEVCRDGDDATERIAALIAASKFLPQLHLLLLDGLALGGFNLIDLPGLAERLALPCLAVMRRPPDLEAIDAALRRFDDYPRRAALLQAAGPIHQRDGFVFQAAGCESETAAEALRRLTDVGNVPEALRLAHLIGSAVKTGSSGRRA